MDTIPKTTNNNKPANPKEGIMQAPTSQQRRVKVVKPTAPVAVAPEAPKAKEQRRTTIEAPAKPAASVPEAPAAKARRVSPEAKAAAEAVGDATSTEATDATEAKTKTKTKAKAKAKAKKPSGPTAKDLDQLAQNLLVLDSLDNPHGDLTAYFGEPFVGNGPLDPTLATVTNPRLIIWKEAYRKKVSAPDLPDHHGKFYKFGRFDISMIASTSVDGLPVTALYPLEGDIALGFNASQFSKDVEHKFEVIPEGDDEFNAFLLKWATALANHGGENLLPEEDSAPTEAD